MRNDEIIVEGSVLNAEPINFWEELLKIENECPDLFNALAEDKWE